MNYDEVFNKTIQIHPILWHLMYITSTKIWDIDNTILLKLYFQKVEFLKIFYYLLYYN